MAWIEGVGLSFWVMTSGISVADWIASSADREILLLMGCRVWSDLIRGDSTGKIVV